MCTLPSFTKFDPLMLWNLCMPDTSLPYQPLCAGLMTIAHAVQTCGLLWGSPSQTLLSRCTCLCAQQELQNHMVSTAGQIRLRAALQTHCKVAAVQPHPALLFYMCKMCTACAHLSAPLLLQPKIKTWSRDAAHVAAYNNERRTLRTSSSSPSV